MVPVQDFRRICCRPKIVLEVVLHCAIPLRWCCFEAKKSQINSKRLKALSLLSHSSDNLNSTHKTWDHNRRKTNEKAAPDNDDEKEEEDEKTLTKPHGHRLFSCILLCMHACFIALVLKYSRLILYGSQLWLLLVEIQVRYHHLHTKKPVISCIIRWTHLISSRKFWKSLFVHIPSFLSLSLSLFSFRYSLCGARIMLKQHIQISP